MKVGNERTYVRIICSLFQGGSIMDEQVCDIFRKLLVLAESDPKAKEIIEKITKDHD